MAKKKMTRDIPLPSSDGMFGGPGDPKKIKAKADSLMTQSRIKKNRAELLADKAKNTENRFPITVNSQTEYMIPGSINLQRKSRVMKASAELDSMKAEGLYKFAKQKK